MHVKDLILLIFIPALLLLLVHSANDISITGLATKNMENENVLGRYSYGPTIKIQKSFDSDKYADMKEKLSNIIKECNVNDIEECIKAKTLDWQCDENVPARILSGFTDRLHECSKQNKGIVCKFNLEKMGEHSGGYKIKLSPYERKIKAIIYSGDELLHENHLDINDLLYTDFSNKDKSFNAAGEINLEVSYNLGNPSIDIFNAGQIDLSKKIILYNAENGLKFIDELEENNFILSASNVVQLPRESGMKFCIKENELEYRFAIRLPKSPLGQIPKIDAFDSINRENEIILQWSSQDRVSSYNIYYSEKDFIDMKIDYIKEDPSVKKINLDISNVPDLGKIDFTKCTIAQTGQRCRYGNRVIESSKLYSSEGNFVYALPNVADDAKYYFAITSISQDGYELDNDKNVPNNKQILESGKNYFIFLSKDDLAPSIIDFNSESSNGKISLTWTKPAKNIDGSDAFDVSFFNIYYKQTNSESLAQLDNTYIKKQISTQDSDCQNGSECKYEMQLNHDLYNIAISVLDEKFNEFKQIEVKQILVN